MGSLRGDDWETRADGSKPESGLYAIAVAILALRDELHRDDNTTELAIYGVANALRALGNGDAATPMGAMEALGLVLKEGLEGVAGALDALRVDRDG